MKVGLNSWAETWRRIWGDQKIFPGPISGKISIFRVKISDDLFLVIDLVLRIFPFFSHIFRMFTMLNVVYDHFLTRKTQFFTLFMLSRPSDNTTSQNIGGTNAWEVPHLKFWGDRSPQSPLGLRPCIYERRRRRIGGNKRGTRKTRTRTGSGGGSERRGEGRRRRG